MPVIGLHITWQEIKTFIDSRTCTKGGKHAYFRTLHTFYTWLYSPKSTLGLDARNNPMLFVEPPKRDRKLLPSLSIEEVQTLIDEADCIRDKAIISLFVDSGLRLTELANIKLEDIDWGRKLIKVKCKGNKEAYAVFGEQTETFIRQWIDEGELPNGNLWNIHRWGIIHVLKDLQAKTGIIFTAHTFRRTFASLLSKRGIDSLHIMRLGRWESMAMVEHYTRSVKFEDSLKLYQQLV